MQRLVSSCGLHQVTRWTQQSFWWICVWALFAIFNHQATNCNQGYWAKVGCRHYSSAFGYFVGMPCAGAGCHSITSLPALTRDIKQNPAAGICFLLLSHPSACHAYVHPAVDSTCRKSLVLPTVHEAQARMDDKRCEACFSSVGGRRGGGGGDEVGWVP